MMHYLKYSATVLIIILTTVQLSAQTNEHHEAGKEEHSLKGSNRFTLGIGHTHVAQGVKEGDKKWLALASWSINYDYWISNKWAVGLQSDIILESFLVEDNGEELIERETPISLVPVAIFKPGKRLSLIGGIGIEFAKSENLTLTRLGLEYGWHLPKNVEVGAAIVWDNKWNYYNSWGLSFTVSKIWPKKHH